MCTRLLVLDDLRTRSTAQSRMPRAFASVAPQQGHSVTRNSSIYRKFRPADMDSDAGMTMNKSARLAL